MALRNYVRWVRMALIATLTADSDDDRVAVPGFQPVVESVRREWRPRHLALARRSQRGTWRIVPGSTHVIGNTQPFAVTSAVFDVLAQAGR